MIDADRSLGTSAVSVDFGGIAALTGIDFSVGRSEIVGLIGPNGAGKTTLVNVLTGYQAPSSGMVRLEGQEITGLAPDKINRRGVSRTFQAVRLFDDLSVLENILAAAVTHTSESAKADAFAWELIDWIGAAAVADRKASGLPYGIERLIGIARALACRPSFLLLDEPAAGTNTDEARKLSDIVRAIPSTFACGVVLIEHNVPLVLATCDRIHVLDAGRTIAVGEPRDIVANPDVRRAYLG
ncbi:MAG: ABC transporter ATP-binding protein [Rhizobiaceae bacterium]